MDDEQEIITYRMDPDANVHNTSKKLEISARYDKLVELLGEPERGTDPTERWRVNWNVEFSDGGVLSVYDWNESDPVENVTRWIVAGHDFMTASRIYEILAGKPIT